MPGRFLPPAEDIGEQLSGGGGVVDAPDPGHVRTRRRVDPDHEPRSQRLFRDAVPCSSRWPGDPGAHGLLTSRVGLRRPVAEPRAGAERGRRRGALRRAGAGVRRLRGSSRGRRLAEWRRQAVPANQVWNVPPGVNMSLDLSDRSRRPLRARRRLPQRRVRELVPCRCSSARCSALPARACAQRPRRGSRWNTTNCMRPFSVADRWTDDAGPVRRLQSLGEVRRQCRRAGPDTTLHPDRMGGSRPTSGPSWF